MFQSNVPILVNRIWPKALSVPSRFKGYKGVLKPKRKLSECLGFRKAHHLVITERRHWQMFAYALLTTHVSNRTNLATFFWSFVFVCFFSKSLGGLELVFLKLQRFTLQGVISSASCAYKPALRELRSGKEWYQNSSPLQGYRELTFNRGRSWQALALLEQVVKAVSCQGTQCRDQQPCSVCVGHPPVNCTLLGNQGSCKTVWLVSGCFFFQANHLTLRLHRRQILSGKRVG